MDGRLVATGATGVRKVGSDVPVTVEDRYHIGSCTKAMTATLAAILVKEKKIGWETTVADVFKGIAIHPERRPTTLKQLLTNTGGCPQNVEEQLWKRVWQHRGSTRSHRMLLVRETLKTEPEYPPGTEFRYSNTGFAIAGAMMEVATGTSWEELMDEKLFEPLLMDSAGFRAPANRGRIDQPYGHNPSPVDPEPEGDNPRAIAPAGAVHLTMADWAKFVQLHLGTSEVTLLDETTA